MARARNIKPSFFQNEDIVELPYEARLLFIGLWNLADREGRLENRPKKIKMSLFPADDINVSEQLSNISKYGFIELYNVDGMDVIQIKNFVKHQSPHGLEKDSELPDKNGIYTVYHRNPKNKTVVGKPIYLKCDKLHDFYNKTGEFSAKNTNPTSENGFNGSNQNTNNNSNNGMEQSNNSYETVSISDQNALNPECGILNPDSLNPECGNTHTRDDGNSLDDDLNLWNPSLDEINTWRKRAGLFETTQEEFNHTMVTFMPHYAPQIRIGTLKQNQVFSKYIAWVKRDYKPLTSTPKAKPQPQVNNRNVNQAWGDIPEHTPADPDVAARLAASLAEEDYL